MNKEQFERYVEQARTHHGVSFTRSPNTENCGVCVWNGNIAQLLAYSSEDVVYIEYDEDLKATGGRKEGWEAVFHWEKMSGLDIVSELNLDLIA